MPHLARYTCHSELMPVIEAALAANGCTLDVCHQDAHTTMLVMSRGAATVLFSQLVRDTRATIEVWGIAGGSIVQLLEALNIPLRRISAVEPSRAPSHNTAAYELGAS